EACVEQGRLGDPGQVLGEQTGGLATPDPATGGGQLDGDACFDPRLGDGDAGALEDLLARGPDADLLADRCCGGRDGAGQEIGGRDAAAMIREEILRDRGGGAAHDQAHQRRRGEGIDLHVIDHQAPRPQVVGALQLLVGPVAASLDRREDPVQGGRVRGHQCFRSSVSAGARTVAARVRAAGVNDPSFLPARSWSVVKLRSRATAGRVRMLRESTGPPSIRQPRWVSSSATWSKETGSAGRVLAMCSSSSAVASRSKPSFGGISASTSSSQRAWGSVPAAAARRVGSSFPLYLRSSFTAWSASRKASTWTARFSRLFFPYQVPWSGTTSEAAITISGLMYPAW